MTDYFFDSSALIKRYITEPGSNWVRAATVISAGHLIIISHITLVEMVSALARRKRDGSILSRTAQAARLLIGRHAKREYEVIHLTDVIIERAQDVLDAHPLRAFDAIQLGTALEINQRILAVGDPPLVFVSSDVRLLTAAAAESLSIYQPV